MIRVLLADDEKIIRMGLRKMIEGNCPEFQVVGEAPDGQTALELLDVCRPDICIVDIRMPRMTGLQFMARAAAAGSRVRMIVLSGYAEFKFAQEAMASGCGGYLLKPVKPEELFALLKKLKASVEDGLEICRREENLQSLSRRHRDATCRELLRRLVIEGGAGEYRILEKEKFLPDQSFVMALFSEDDYRLRQGKPAEDSGGGSGAVILRTTDMLLREEPRIFGISLSLMQDLTLLLLYSRDKGEVAQETAVSFLKKAQNALRDREVSVTIGFCGADRGIDKIRENYLACREAVGCRFYQGKGRIFSYQKDFFSKEAPKIYPLEKELSVALFVQNNQQVFAILNDIFALLKNMHVKKSVCAVILCHIHLDIMNILRTRDKTEMLKSLPDLAEYERHIQTFDLFSELQEYVFDFFYRLLEQDGGDQNERNRNLVRKAMRYVETHYESPIYSNEMAEYLNLNVSYFSTLFRKETGEKFTVFLTNFKMEKACEMLLQTNEKVCRISERLGYNDVKYFCKVFRRRMNCTPSEYREGMLRMAAGERKN